MAVKTLKRKIEGIVTCGETRGIGDAGREGGGEEIFIRKTIH